jgi:hypothetical protein
VTGRPNPLSPAEAKALIDRLLSVYDGLSLTEHCRGRSRARQFDIFDITHVLRTGLPSLDGWDDKHQNWKCRVSGHDFEGETLTVVIVFNDDPQLVKVLTAHD